MTIISLFWILLNIPLGQPQPAYPLLYESAFAHKATLSDLSEFSFSDPQAWRMKDGAVELFDKSDYQPAVRSPFNMAVLNNLELGSFIMEITLKQTGREYGHRDLCLMFGIQDTSHFYYVHMATAADENAHNVFIVNGKPRTNIGHPLTTGVSWGEDWHNARIVRNSDEGVIEIYFDDKLIIEAKDQRFRNGYVGFGSFDDTGMFESIKIWGEKKSDTRLELFD